MDHALDAVFVWLDSESLLRAGAVCRRWAERASRPEAWRGRVAGVEWARDLTPRDAYRRSLNVRARWLRGRHVAMTALVRRNDVDVLCADGRRLAYRCADEAVGAVAADDADDRWDGTALAWVDAIRICDVASGRTVGSLPVHVVRVALARENVHCATTGPQQDDSDRELLQVWSPAAAAAADCGTSGGVDVVAEWRPTCTATLGATEHMYDSGLQWQGDRLLLYRGVAGDAGEHVAEWFDVGDGEARVAARHSYRDGTMHGTLVCLGASAFAVSGRAIYALDPRAPPGGTGPLMTLRSGARGAHEDTKAGALDDGRHVVTYPHDSNPAGSPLGIELWDVRAARTDAAPVAARYDRGWERLPCATARGTVLGWVRHRCRRHGITSFVQRCGECCASLVEWDPARNSVETRLDVRTSAWVRCVWADERRALLHHPDNEIYLVDADAPPP